MAVTTDQDVDLRPAGADAADHGAQDERHLGPVGRLAGPQDDRDRLARDRLVDVDRQEAPAVVVGMEERELLATVHPDLLSSMSSTIRRGTCSKLSQNSSTMAAIMRLSAVVPGRFSSRDMVGC